jgi:hypothetical protein
MRKLAVLIVAILSVLLLVPEVACASTPTLKSLAKSVAALQKQVKTQTAQIKSLKTQLAKAKPVLALAPYVSLTDAALNGVTGPNVVFTGVNVHIRSASSEDDISGLGNLIVGWDPGSTLVRTGSNNLVCGGQNSFTSYGCFVAGGGNTVSGYFSSVCGGQLNQASAPISCVCGGGENVAGGTGDVIGGGWNLALSDQTGYAWQAGDYHTP